MTLSNGQVLNGRYRIDGLIAIGGFGAVYRAYDSNLKRPCAVKENLETDPGAQHQFELEATVLANLSHPNLPRMIDHFVISGQGQYLVMDFVEGDNLQEILDRVGGPLPESRVLSWIEQICDALTYLHSQHSPIIHRDIKPLNIILSPDEQTVKLVDFGIIKVGSGPTAKAARGATEGYSPSEQYHGHTDARSDVYALGATLHTLLTGRQPPASTDRAAGVFLPPPRSLNPGIGPRIENAIQKAMALSQADRFQTVAEFKVALRAPVVSTLLSRWAWIAGALVMAVIALVIVFPEDEPQPAISRPVSPIWTEVASTSNTPAPPSMPGVDTTATIQSLHETQTAVAALDAVTPTPTATLTLVIGATLISPVDGMVMVYVPEGDFLMGSSSLDSLAEVYERPQRTVYLNAFWIDQTEITNSMFALFVDATGYITQAETAGWSWDFSGTAWNRTQGADWRHPRGSSNTLQGLGDHPAVRISWNDALAYCSWADRRLLTEAEWEKAARGTDGRIYPWGDASPSSSLLNYTKNIGITRLVGSYPGGSSPYSVYDMAGNVWEWVADWYREDYYSVAPDENPVGPPDGDGRVMRGGSWFTSQKGVRSAYREWGRQDESYWSTGFRCAMDVEP